LPQPKNGRTGLKIEAAWILALLVAAGAVLRLVDLGAISFHWDEDLSALAAKAIAEHGIPELPSGMIYLRGLAFSYAMAASGMWLGFDEAALRLPAALFGIALIPLSFVFGKRLFGASVGLVLAALVTFSFWDIEFSRYARMYAPFGFLYLLTLLLIWRYRVVETSFAGGALALVSALLAISLHELGYTLALAFLLPVAIRGREAFSSPRGLIFPVTACGIAAAAFFVWQRIQDRYYYRAASLASAEAAPSGEGAGQAIPGSAGADGDAGLIERILDSVRLPDLPLFSALYDAAPWAAIGLVAAALGFAAVVLVAARRVSVGERLLLGAVALCCALQLFNVALLAGIALAFAKRRGLAGLREPDVVTAIAMIGTGFAAWLVLALGLDLVGDLRATAAAKETVKRLLDYPSFFVFWGFPSEYPLMSIPALIGLLWAFDRAARPEPDRPALFLLAAFALPVVLNGLFESRYGFFRYNVPFGPLFFAFVALGLVRWTDVFDAWRPSARPLTRAGVTAGTAALAALVVVYDASPLRGWLVAQREHDDRSALSDAFKIRGFRDYRSAAEHVLQHAAPGDEILTFECREYFNYIGRLDYCLISGTYRSGDELIQTYVHDGVLRDLYVAVPLITSAKELERTLRKTPGTKWLLASTSVLDNDQAIGADFRRLLEDNAHRVVHVARDGDTMVYRF